MFTRVQTLGPCLQVMEGSAAPADAKAAAGTPKPKAEAADQSKEKTKDSGEDKKEAGGRTGKAQKKDSKDAKEDKAASKSKVGLPETRSKRHCRMSETLELHQHRDLFCSGCLQGPQQYGRQR